MAARPTEGTRVGARLPWRAGFAVRLLSWLLVSVALVGVAALPGSSLRGRDLVRLADQPAAPPLPPEVGPPRTASVTVRAEDEAGRPVAGAQLTALAVVDERARLAASAVTDAEGRAVLGALPEGAEHWIVARAPGRARAATSLVALGTERVVTLLLGPEHVLDVAVTDENGAPLEGAEIEVRGGDPLPVGARTGIDGTARVGGLREPPWGVVVRASGYEEVLTPKQSEGARLTVALRRLGSILVHVEDERGIAVEDARVAVSGPALWPPREGRTGARGMVKLAGLLAGSYALRATHGSRVSPTELAIALERGEDKELVLRLAPGRHVLVRVTDGDGDGAWGVAGARVTLVEGGLSPFPLEGVTGKDGRVMLGPIGAGEASVSVSADGFADHGPVPVPAGNGELRVALERAATLTGRVVDARGRPVDGARLEVVGTDFAGMPIEDRPLSQGFRAAHFQATLAGPRPLVPAGELGVVPGPVPAIPRAGVAPPAPGALLSPSPRERAPWVSALDGTFRLSPVTPGRVRVVVRHPEYVEVTSDVVTLGAGGERDVVVVLRAGGTLEGRVLDAAGRAVSGAAVVLSALHSPLERTTRTGTDGSFAFAAVPDAVVLGVFARQDDLQPALRLAVSVAEGEHKSITLRLPAERAASIVRVKDDRGYPVAGAEVRALSLDPAVPSRATGFTDARGEASLPGLAGLPARLEVVAPRHATKVQTEQALRESVEITLEPSEIVQGEVRDSRGRGVGGAMVAAYTEVDVRRTQTDPSGAWQLRDVAVGPVRVTVQAPGFASAEVRFDVRAGRGRPVEAPRIELAEESRVEGRVVGPRGEPVRGARVARDRAPTYLPAGAPPASVAVTDGGGAFVLRGLPSGAIDLEAYAPELGRGRVQVVASRGRTTSGVLITLRGEDGGAAPASSGGVAVTLAEREGAVWIADVAPGSEAERAGLRAGDRVASVDGKAPASMEDARAGLAGPLADDVVVRVEREGRELSLRVARERIRR
jgi:protocatechuate 3,4-dioxygenase beta subunit